MRDLVTRRTHLAIKPQRTQATAWVRVVSGRVRRGQGLGSDRSSGPDVCNGGRPRAKRRVELLSYTHRAHVHTV